ncbi:MAG: ankyrin repeat protein 6 [Gammaproteobacteria bacterium]|nr:ankyrin repeat protein 6 [Gammaproteobacteria bacterium]
MQAARTLFNAARDGNVKDIQKLLKAGADLNNLENNVPAVWDAAFVGHEEAAMVLLSVTDSRLINNKHSYFGSTMLHLAAQNGKENVIQAALAQGANPDALNKYNVPAVYNAVYAGNKKAALALLEVTDIRLLSNKHSYFGSTTLHIAVKEAMVDFVKAAVLKGADLYVKDAGGKTALDIITKSSAFTREQKAEILKKAAWARRGSLVMLRRRCKQAWEAEMDAKEAAAQAPCPAAPDP